MNTTIKISTKNHRKLFELKKKIESESGKEFSFNDLVGMIIEKIENIESNQLIDDLQSIKGILTVEDVEDFRRVREIDKKRENKFISY